MRKCTVQASTADIFVRDNKFAVGATLQTAILYHQKDFLFVFSLLKLYIDCLFIDGIYYF